MLALAVELVIQNPLPEGQGRSRGRILFLASLLGLACSHTVKHDGLEGCEPDCPHDWPAPDAEAGTGKVPIRLDGGRVDGGEPGAFGEPCASRAAECPALQVQVMHAADDAGSSAIPGVACLDFGADGWRCSIGCEAQYELDTCAALGGECLDAKCWPR